ncbi:hypothetical protein ILYODFUR_019379 [Ilyodon furcidens]|uniref:Uncharacterized protein n=1 Tax=Ilyodon furcidens TaxID=33524 RepID=A0ABV0UVM4_9TELE
MLLVTRVFLLLGFASVLPAASKKRVVSVQLGKELRPRRQTVKLTLDPSVNSYLSLRSASNIGNLSLSPWTYIDSFNPFRLPKKILQANCSTSGCLNLQDGGEDATLEAKPIKYQVLVLYRVIRRLEHISSCHGMRGRYTLDRLPGQHKDTQDRQPYTHTYT